MSRLVRLYPKAWRARYEAELQETLESRPMTSRDRVDLIRGALDARIHPELAESVPVLAGAGAGVDLGTRPHPSAMTFVTSVGVAAFLLAGWLVHAAGGLLLGGRELQQALLAMGATALGVIVWWTGRDRVVWRLAAVALILSALGPILTLLPEVVIPWRALERRSWVVVPLGLISVAVMGVAVARLPTRFPRPSSRVVGVACFGVVVATCMAIVFGVSRSEGFEPWMPLRAHLPAVLPIVVGTLMLGAHVVVKGTPDRATGIVLIALAIALATGYWLNGVRLVALTSFGFAVAVARLGWWPGTRVSRPRWLATRDVLPGIVAGLGIVGVVAGWSIGTTAWTEHDGFPLRCDIERERCLAIVEQVVGDVSGRSHAVGIEWVRVDALGGFGVCWSEPVNGRECWFGSTAEIQRQMGP